MVSVKLSDVLLDWGDKSKQFGLVVVPVFDRVGITTSRKVQAVVDTVFEQGEPAISTIKR